MSEYVNGKIVERSEKKVCNLCKNKSHKMIWGVFGLVGVLVYCAYNAHTIIIITIIRFHIHLFVHSISWCVQLLYLAMLLLLCCCYYCCCYLLNVVLETLTRIINLSNNKPIWARFKTAKVLNAYYLFWNCLPYAFASSSLSLTRMQYRYAAKKNGKRKHYINTTI